MQLRAYFSLSIGRLLIVAAVIGLNQAWISSKALAAIDVTISSNPTINMSLSGGVYTPTASPAVLNVSDLLTQLSSGNVSVKTSGTGSSLPGNITLAASISSGSWTANTLTLDAETSIIIGTASVANVQLAAGGTAGLVLTTNDGGSGGQLAFTNGGSITFANTAESLTINTKSYQLVSTMSGTSGLENLVNTTPSGYFAVAQTFGAGGTFSASPISSLTGIIEGLGNSITGLAINDGTAGQSSAFITSVGSTGAINDLSLSISSVLGTASTSGGSMEVAGLVAINQGTLANDSVVPSTGSPTIQIACHCNPGYTPYVGGLAGENQGTITNSRANVNMISDVNGTNIGGLVGYNVAPSSTVPAVIQNSSSTAAVTGSSLGSDFVGGLVGINTSGEIISSSATGATVTCNVALGDTAGGLVGDSQSSVTYPLAEIESSYSTNTVGSLSNCSVTGGLVGVNGSYSAITAVPVTSGPAVASYAS